MIQDPEIMKAVSQILQRSERQEDLSKLLHTFVDVGILPQLQNRNNQIIYGRRGTGKTHVLRVLLSGLRDVAKNTVVYIDARTLGSSTQFSDYDQPMSKRCLALFRDVLGEIHNALLEHIVINPNSYTNLAIDALAELEGAITEGNTVAIPGDITKTEESKNSNAAGLNVVVSNKDGIGGGVKIDSRAGRKKSYRNKIYS